LLSEITWRARKATKKAEALLGAGRYVDMGLRIYVVRRHAKGAIVIPGLAPVVSLRSVDFGGVYDRLLRKYVGPSERPRIWYANERAIDLIVHGSELPPGLLAYGGMGCGKTTGILAPWLVVRMLEFAKYAPIEIGGTAPTDPRLEEYITAVKRCMRADWYTYNDKKHLFRCRNGVKMRLLGTAPRSASQGSKIQSWNWGAVGIDELQDSIDEYKNILARGRRAPGGVYKRAATVTAKESPGWREFRDRIKASGQWAVSHFEGQTNPFVWPAYWDGLKSEYSERDYKRIVLAQDVGPERAVYSAFTRDDNVRPVPQVGAKDVTYSRVNAAALVGHDPGTLQDVSLVLKCFRVREGRGYAEHWYVIDEVTSPQSTTEEHVLQVRKQLQEVHDLQWPGEDEPKVLVRCDPQGDSDQRTDRSVYTTWRQAGFHIKSAAYSVSANGQKVTPKGRVPKEPDLRRERQAPPLHRLRREPQASGAQARGGARDE
jgi:hypothetical protein